MEQSTRFFFLSIPFSLQITLYFDFVGAHGTLLMISFFPSVPRNTDHNVLVIELYSPSAPVCTNAMIGYIYYCHFVSVGFNTFTCIDVLYTV